MKSAKNMEIYLTYIQMIECQDDLCAISEVPNNLGPGSFSGATVH